jgi:hypothetical protein
VAGEAVDSSLLTLELAGISRMMSVKSIGVSTGDGIVAAGAGALKRYWPAACALARSGVFTTCLLTLAFCQVFAAEAFFATDVSGTDLALIAAHLFFCAAAILFRTAALSLRLAFATAAAGSATRLIFFQRSRCAFAILRRAAALTVRFGVVA